MRVEPMSVDGCWIVHLERHHDHRGWFSEALNRRELAATTGYDFSVAQFNVSLSDQGVIRGIHYSMAKGGQAKYIQCLRGSILDVVVDLRLDSAGFGSHDAVKLDETSAKAILVAEGCGHGFAVTEGPAQLVYATSSPYNPEKECAITPFDSRLGISWPSRNDFLMSEQDRSARTLQDAVAGGLLPRRGVRS